MSTASWFPFLAVVRLHFSFLFFFCCCVCAFFFSILLLDNPFFLSSLPFFCECSLFLSPLSLCVSVFSAALSLLVIWPCVYVCVCVCVCVCFEIVLPPAFPVCAPLCSSVPCVYDEARGGVKRVLSFSHTLSFTVFARGVAAPSRLHVSRRGRKRASSFRSFSSALRFSCFLVCCSLSLSSSCSSSSLFLSLPSYATK